ncbi:MAG: sulfite exporter TauE/SafE family protein [Polyangiaceae bacterium]
MLASATSMPGHTTGDIIVAAAAFLAAMITGALGYGFSSITVPVALLFVPSKTLAPALVLLELATNLLGLIALRREVPAVVRRMLPILVGLLPGVALGSWALLSVSGSALKIATYAVLLPLVMAQTAGLRWPLRREAAVAVPTGLAIGTLYSATTISGPPLALFLNNQGLPPTEFRAAIYLVRVAESVATTIAYLVFGLFTAPASALATKLLPSLVLGLPLGVLLLRRVSPEAFRRISMAASAAFIAFGLARALVEIGVLASAVAYGAMSVVLFIEGALLVRFFASQRA